MNKAVFLSVCLVVVLIGFGLFVFQKPESQISITSIDELAGSWSAAASVDAEYQWSVVYTFDGKGTYSMRTDSQYKEDGKYEIAQRREDGTRLVHKTYGTPELPKEYDMEVGLHPDGKTMIIDGMVLTKDL